MSDEFKPGDVVELKSGGVSLTVGRVDFTYADVAECYYSAPSGICVAVVPVEALTHPIRELRYTPFPLGPVEYRETVPLPAYDFTPGR